MRAVVPMIDVQVMMGRRPAGGLLAEGSFTDPDNARIIYLMAAGLVVLAAALTAITVWWWRGAKSEHPALGPLEVMGTRRFTRADHPGRERRLEAARPEGSVTDADRRPAPDPVDLQAVVRSTPPHYDDLLDASLSGEPDDGREEAADEHDDTGAAVAPVAAGTEGEDEVVADRTPPGQVIDPLLRMISGD